MVPPLLVLPSPCSELLATSPELLATTEEDESANRELISEGVVASACSGDLPEASLLPRFVNALALMLRRRIPSAAWRATSEIRSRVALGILLGVFAAPVSFDELLEA